MCFVLIEIGEKRETILLYRFNLSLSSSPYVYVNYVSLVMQSMDTETKK